MADEDNKLGGGGGGHMDPSRIPFRVSFTGTIL